MEPRKEIVTDSGHCINWFGCINDRRIGVLFDPARRVTRIDIDGKSKPQIVMEDMQATVHSIASITSLIECCCENQLKNAESIGTFCQCVAFLSGLGLTVTSDDLSPVPEPFQDTVPFVYAYFGQDVECSPPESERDSVAFFTFERLFIGCLNGRLFKIEVRLAERRIRILMVATTTGDKSPIPSDGEWIDVKDFDDFWLP